MRLTLSVLALIALPALADAACLDVSKGEPKTLSGLLSHRIFAGPPGYQDVDKGDAPEPGYILKLAAPICLTGEGDLTDPSRMFDEVQLVATDATAEAMRRETGQFVKVELSNPTPEHTAHHRRPLVAWVDRVERDTAMVAPASAAEEEDGTAAPVVRAFYAALFRGDGVAASKLIVPEKRAKGPFSARALGRFYGALDTPIELLGLEAESEFRYRARYYYVAGNRTCNGTATISLVADGESYLIKGIKAHDGC